MQAIILAAGKGERLRPLTKSLPKGLITIGKKSLLEYSLDALQKKRIKEVIIVVGFHQEEIKRRFGENYKGLKIIYVSNDEYNKTGSMYSLSKVEYLLRDDTILLLESDLLYESKAIKIILEAPYRNCILVSRISNSGDEVYICVDQNLRITNLGKNISQRDKKAAVGEMVGVSKFSKEFLRKVFNNAQKYYKEGIFNIHYEECVFETSKLGCPIYGVLCKNLVWIEVDTEDDLKKAKENIYPKIEKLLGERNSVNENISCYKRRFL